MALARLGEGPARAAGAWEMAEGLEGPCGGGLGSERGGGQASCVVDLSRPPFPCASDGLDLYTCRQAMRVWGADKGAAWPAGRRERRGPEAAGSKEGGGPG